MKQTFLFITTVALALSSCSVEAPQGVTGPIQGTLTISIAATMPTKAQTAAEKTLHNVSLFVFNFNSGELEQTLDLGEGATSATFSLSPGTKTIWAYANQSVSAAGTTLADHPITGSGALVQDAFGSSCFAMRGSANVTLSSGGNISRDLYLSRCASRVVVSGIRNNLPGSHPLTITGAYLADAYLADTPGTALPGEGFWANRWGRNDTHELPVLLAASNSSWTGADLPHTIPNGSLWTVPQIASAQGPRMYCMPNTASAQGSPWTPGATWTPRVTKLVLIACIGTSTPFFYPIPLPDLQTNESREYVITINGIGTSDPEDPAGTLTCSVAPATTPYDTGPSYTESTD